MSFLAVGINHRTAPLSLRETVAFAPRSLVPALRDIRKLPQVAEAMILSTCNRTEIYTRGEQQAEALTAWLSHFHQADPALLAQHSYRHSGREAIEHIMRVAAGLDSMVLGEPQILGQMKSAFAKAREAGSLSTAMDRLFQHVFSTVKEVRTHTEVGVHPVSVARAAVSLAQQIFTDLSQNKVLLIGAGDTVELAVSHLSRQGIGQIMVANRTLAHAQRLAARHGGKALELSDLPLALEQADIVIACTSSPLPLLGKGAVESAQKRRRHMPQLMVDLAVPRDIEPEVGTLDDVYLYTIDDLQDLVSNNLHIRQTAALQAEKLIAAGAENFLTWLRERDADTAVCTFRQKAAAVQEQQLANALRLLENGQPADEVMKRLARGLTNKLIHAPCAQLRQMGGLGQGQQLDWAWEFLELGGTRQPGMDRKADRLQNSGDAAGADKKI